MTMQLKRITYAPRKGKYRVVIDGVIQPGNESLLTKAQVLALGLEFIERGTSFAIGRAGQQSPPKKKPEATKRRTKHR